MPGLALGLLLMLAAFYLIAKSPQRGQTLVRMAFALVATILLCLIPGSLLHIGDPEDWGQIGALAGLLVAVIFGWWHVRSLTHLAPPA